MTKSDEFEIVKLHAAKLDAPLTVIRDQINASLGTNFTTRNISKAISRNRKLLERLLNRKPRKISIHRPCELWGIDLSEVRVFFVFRIQVLGILDYFGSRLIVLQPLSDLDADSIISAIESAFSQNGKPARFISDNGSVFRSGEFRNFLKSHDIKHTFIRPAHPWTNGRIERLFRTFKDTIAICYPMILNAQQLISICAEFIVYYNEARPHSRWNHRTPDEVYLHRPRSKRATPTTFFEGRLKWYRFGY